jgi:hypothetical protein
MSRSENKPKTYLVGYGRPPKEYSFKPGQSGNPSGKGKKRERTTEWGTLGELIIQEAYRRVRVREGDKTVVLPAIQAALRVNLTSAVQGDKRAD